MWSMVWSSDTVTKVVMIGLLLASVWSWAIIIDKIATLREVKQRSRSFESKFWSGGSLDKLYESIGNRPVDPMSAMFVAAMREWKRTNIMKSKTDRGLRGVSLQQRIEKAMAVSMDKEVDGLDTKMGFLASTGSVAPLVGLFGTVWGIINSFNAIAATQSNSLAAIAPGIAEALFTTAFGLIAAIPAVVAYNKISSDIDRYANRLENFATEFSSILSREIDDTTIRAEMAGE
ncbi:MAG: protein TolQ [Alphaproteobacteria bacterium]|nr:protein TolQ [Alphaproteobacteria bacterium]